MKSQKPEGTSLTALMQEFTLAWVSPVQEFTVHIKSFMTEEVRKEAKSFGLTTKKLKFMAPFTLGLACNVRHKLSVTASTKLYPLKIAYSLGPKSPKLKKGRIFIKKVAVCVIPNISEFIRDPTFPWE